MEEIGNKVSTAADLYILCGELVRQGKGDAKLMFDTDAQNFDVHMVPVTFASWMSADIMGEEVFCLSNTEPYGKYAKRG